MSESLHEPARPFGRALARGFACRCPACGRGRMFRAYLKVAETCEACGLELRHHQADDAPAYFVIVIVGHIVVPLSLAVETAFAPALWLHAAIWLPLTTGLTLALLMPVKGTIVAWQWANGMHAFGPGDDAEPPSEPHRSWSAETRS